MSEQIPESALQPSGETGHSIELLRSALHSIADRETAPPSLNEWLAPARKRRRAAQRRMVLAWACAAALCFAVLPFSMHGRQHASAPAAAVKAAPVVTDTQSDTALLEQVDTEIAEPVPSSLAPLTELDSWNSTTSTTTSSFDRTEKKNVTQ
jgi:hypothetical protein